MHTFISVAIFGWMLLSFVYAAYSEALADIGREVAIPHHLQDGEEFDVSVHDLIAYGKKLFDAHFTREEGAGRPLTKGTGAPLSDPDSPLVFPRNNNRVSGPESNSCSGCHNQPIAGGAGDLSSNVFVLGQRFDFATFDANDVVPTRGAMDERGRAVTLQSIRDRLRPGQRARLVSKGIFFGLLVAIPMAPGTLRLSKACRRNRLRRRTRSIRPACSFCRSARPEHLSPYVSSPSTPSISITACKQPSGSASEPIPTATALSMN